MARRDETRHRSRKQANEERKQVTKEVRGVVSEQRREGVRGKEVTTLIRAINGIQGIPSTAPPMQGQVRLI